MSATDRYILVVERAKLPKQIPTDGFVPITKQELEEICELSEFKIRNEMEENPEYKQLIPYIAVLCNGKVLTYKRSTQGNDARLHEKYSLGIGGHIDLVPEITSHFDTFKEAVERETEEELGITVSYSDMQLKGFINQDDGGIGQVHVGVGIIYECEEFDLTSGETDVLVERQFMTIQDAMNLYDKMESWSQIFLREYLTKL